MDVMSLRRGLLLEKQTDCPYVTNGLIFWLDGINKDNDQQKWTDIIGGITFDLTGTAFSQNGVVFNSSSYGEYDGYIGTGYDSDTIEAVLDGSSLISRCILNQDVSHISPICLMHGTGSNGGYRMDAQKQNMVFIPDFSKAISVNSEYAVVDFNETSYGNLDYWAANRTGKTYIGTRHNGSQLISHYVGTIHCIRIYNRHLTVEEMIFNQRIDNNRFNLGLGS